MASLERLDSAKFGGGRSNFSQTCSLLSQYLKEKGSFGDLTLGLTSNVAVEPKGTTLNLLPMIEKSGRDVNANKSDISAKKPESETSAPLTMFYRGQVIVFDNFPADKAEEILALARRSVASPPRPTQSPVESATATPLQSPQSTLVAPPRLPLADLPIARTKSLARFLEKRKDRITANAPYQVMSKPMGSSATKPVVKVESGSWLGLASKSTLDIQRRH